MTPTVNLPRDAAPLEGFARDLREFTVDRVAQRVGENAVAALEREDPLPARRAAAGEDALGVLIRLFLLGEQVSAADAARALPNSSDDAAEWGILAGTDQVRATIDLRPTTIAERDVWLAADLGEIATGQALPADHVLGLGGASATLVDLTIRSRVTRALDLGAGSGIQTLGLLTHAQEVLATDISARALDFAAFTLALNESMAGPGEHGATGARGRVRLAHGSFFEPVDGDFDLIVSNPPFVVSPRATSLATYTYRDGGFAGDGVIRHLIEEVPARLRPGGVAQMLANWEVHAGQEWQERIGGWVRATGIDAWVVQREFLDPAHYVHTWLRDGGLTPERDPGGYENAYLEWLGDFESRGVTGVGFGYITLRRPARPREPWVRLEEITGTLGGGLGSTVARTLEVVDLLAATSDADLLTWYLKAPGDVTEERYHRPGHPDPSVILLRQGGGFSRAVQVDTLVAAAVGACDGDLTLGQICSALAHLFEADPADVIAQVLPTIRGLLTDGILLRVDGERATLNS